IQLARARRATAEAAVKRRPARRAVPTDAGRGWWWAVLVGPGCRRRTPRVLMEVDDRVEPRATEAADGVGDAVEVALVVASRRGLDPRPRHEQADRAP